MDEDLNETNFYFSLYFSIIHMLALDRNDEQILYILIDENEFKLNKKDYRFHIKRVKSNYKDCVEILYAIYYARAMDFVKLGASWEVALECFYDWLRNELT